MSKTKEEKNIEEQLLFVRWLKANKMYDPMMSHYMMQWGHEIWKKCGKPGVK